MPPPSTRHEQPSRDWIVAGVAAGGCVVSVYLTATKLSGGGPLFCEAGGGCDVVQSSRYALFLGVPTAAWGAALYAVVVAIALAGLTARRWLIVYALAAAAVAFSAYLVYLQVAVLHALCPWCIADAAIAGALAAVVVVRRPTGRRRPGPARMALVGGAVAVATVVFAAGVYVADAPTQRPAYREALARHLAATGAIFYGAYW